MCVVALRRLAPRLPGTAPATRRLVGGADPRLACAHPGDHRRRDPRHLPGNARAVALADLSDGEPDSYPEGTELVVANVATALHTYRADEPVTAEWFHRRHRNSSWAAPERPPRLPEV